MIHPSYFELMNVVNQDVKEGEDPIITSRYSIVLGTAKRARQLVAANRTTYKGQEEKPLSIAVDELKNGEIHIVREGYEPETEEEFFEEELTEEETLEEAPAEEEAAAEEELPEEADEQ